MTNYKNLFNKLLDQAIDKCEISEKENQEIDDDVFCTYNDLERAKENDFKTQIRRLNLLDEEIEYYKELVKDRETERANYLSNYEV
jgi:polyhydroxyalkanoate synthesis regulator phasin